MNNISCFTSSWHCYFTDFICNYFTLLTLPVIKLLALNSPHGDANLICITYFYLTHSWVHEWWYHVWNRPVHGGTTRPWMGWFHEWFRTATRILLLCSSCSTLTRTRKNDLMRRVTHREAVYELVFHTIFGAWYYEVLWTCKLTRLLWYACNYEHLILYTSCYIQ